MLQSIKIRKDTYARVKAMAKADRRTILAMLDIIVEQYEESLCKKEQGKTSV